MKKFLLTTIEPFWNDKVETRLVPARTQREAEEKTEPYQVLVKCEPYQGKAANRYIAYVNGLKNKKRA